MRADKRFVNFVVNCVGDSNTDVGEKNSEDI